MRITGRNPRQRCGSAVCALCLFAPVTLAAGRQEPPKPAVTTPPAGVTETPVFTSGTEGYKSFRIPSLLLTKRGVLLAFCEGRRTSGKDAGDIDLVLRRSEDGGKTWGAIQTVWSDGENTCGNPCPILDEKTGAVVLLMTRNQGTDTEKEIVAGTSKESRTVWVCRSEDDGKTWSTPRDITASVKLPDWTWFATGPGIGIQKQRGSQAGRLIVPCDHSDKASRWSHVIYSDDAGETWKRGGSAPTMRTDESQVAERSDGSLILNMRAASPKEPSRGTCISTDGGDTWKDFRHDPVLIESRCQGSLISLPAPGKPLLLFSNPADNRPKGRTHLTLRLSRDEGATWSNALVLHPGFSAYSCLSPVPGGEIGCLYERGDAKAYETITFARLPLKMLTN